MTKSEHVEFGRRGERAAALYLRSCGWEIVETNWRFEHGEIDLIGWRRERRYGAWCDVLNVVEVKTRRRAGSFRPEDAVGARKRRTIVQGATRYLQGWPCRQVSVRFDVIGVVWAGHLPQITHHAHAFTAEVPLNP